MWVWRHKLSTRDTDPDQKAEKTHPSKKYNTCISPWYLTIENKLTRNVLIMIRGTWPFLFKYSKLILLMFILMGSQNLIGCCPVSLKLTNQEYNISNKLRCDILFSCVHTYFAVGFFFLLYKIKTQMQIPGSFLFHLQRTHLYMVPSYLYKPESYITVLP